MKLTEAVLARSRVYALFSHLFGRGLTVHVLPLVRSIPDLETHMQERFDEDEAAADHYALFSLDVFPYASLFLEATGFLGGPTTDRLQRLYAQTEFQPPFTYESADHLGNVLSLLAFLSGAEADALMDHSLGEAERMRQIQQRVLDSHLLGWLLPFVQAVRRQSYPFYTTLIDLALDVVLNHRAVLSEGVITCALPEPPPLLEDEKTGLKDIAVYLTTPAWSGLYLSRRDIARLSLDEHLPRGFGSRVQTLTNLLRAAAEFDRTDALLNALLQEISVWQHYYQTFQRNEQVAVHHVAQTWLDRLSRTERMIQRMAEAAQSPAS